MASGKAVQEVVEFARRWSGAGPLVVQAWDSWEAIACEFFGVSAADSAGEMHAVMSIVESVAFGSPEDVKAAVREARPDAVEIAHELLAHLPQFDVVLEAEIRFRAGDLCSDWSLQLVDGKLVARSEFRAGHDTH